MKNVLILTVGGTLAPLVKSVKTFIPDYIFLIASQDTIDLAVELKKEAKVLSPGCAVEIATVDEPESLQACHEVARKVALKAVDIPDSQIRVDYTGGTKSMSAAAVLATADFHFEYAYTGGERRDRENIGRVLDGYEKLIEMPVPLSYLQGAELEHVRQLYSGWNFDAARQYCEYLGHLLGKTLAGEFYRGLEKVMEGFYWWDNFRHDTAQRAFSKTDLDVLQSHELAIQDKRLKKFLKGVKKSQERLNTLTAVTKGKTVKPSVELARDLLANADRRADEGRFDDAILRLYRIIEMTVQATLLEKYGIETDNVPVNKLSQKEFNVLTAGEPVKRNTLKLSQENAVRLLELKGHPLWTRMAPEEKTRKKIQQVRNYCYLEHQLERAADRNKFDGFRKYVLRVMFEGENAENFPVWRPAVRIEAGSGI